MNIKDRSVQGIIDALENGSASVNWAALSGLPKVRKPILLSVPQKVVPANDVLGRIYFPTALEFTQVYLFVETGTCTVNLSVNGGASTILQSVTATPSGTTLSLSSVVAARDWAKLDITAADSNTAGLTILLDGETDFVNILVV